ncbi:hypothetical protein HG531_004003 [Fusarium graminearum]|nr:hypothetical protein HG531_004003 [Fusarium graminearum]
MLDQFLKGKFLSGMEPSKRQVGPRYSTLRDAKRLLLPPCGSELHANLGRRTVPESSDSLLSTPGKTGIAKFHTLEGTKSGTIEDSKVLSVLALNLVGLGISSDGVKLHACILSSCTHSLCDLLGTAVDAPPVLDILGSWVVIHIIGVEVKFLQDALREGLVVPSGTTSKGHGLKPLDSVEVVARTQWEGLALVLRWRRVLLSNTDIIVVVLFIRKVVSVQTPTKSLRSRGFKNIVVDLEPFSLEIRMIVEPIKEQSSEQTGHSSSNNAHVNLTFSLGDVARSSEFFCDFPQLAYVDLWGNSDVSFGPIHEINNTLEVVVHGCSSDITRPHMLVGLCLLMDFDERLFRRHDGD